jgi:hypothetical protein
MNFSEAINSNKPFKRQGSKDWLIFVNGELRYLDRPEWCTPVLFFDDYSAEDWETKKIKVKKEGWIHIYKSKGEYLTSHNIYDRKQDAAYSGDYSKISIVKIQLEVEE